MEDRFSVGFDADNHVWFICDSYGLKPSGGTYETRESAVKYCDWLNTWIKE